MPVLGLFNWRSRIGNTTMNTKNERISMTQPRVAVPVRKRTPASRADWPLLVGLMVMSAVPSLAGVIRLVGLAGGAEITPDNTRFFAVPLPVVLHIISALPFCVLGAFQLAPGFRRRWPAWHRRAGRLLVLCGIVAGLSGLWMTQFYPLYPRLQDNLLYGFRILFGSAMVLSITLGLIAILRRDIAQHRAWMIRGYAIGQGAGTQALTGLLWVLIFGTMSEPAREWLLGVSWIINLAVAEWIIRRHSLKGRQRQRKTQGTISARAVV